MNSSKLEKPIGFSPQEISALVNKDVVTQHAEDAAFLWLLRDQAVLAPNYSVKDLADLDERVEANIDGLRIAKEFGWNLCEDALANEEPGEVFAAGVLAFESKDKKRIQKVLAIGCSSYELMRGLISALGWIPFKQIEDLITKFLDSENMAVRAIGISAFAAHREDPGISLQKAIIDHEPQLRRCAIKAAGRLGRVDLLRFILQCISDKDDNCRFFSAWSAARLGERSIHILDKLKEFAATSGPLARPSLDIVLRCMALPGAKKWQQQLLENPGTRRQGVIGIGVIGDPCLIEKLIPLMEEEEFARVAGEAFSNITGIDLEYENLDQDQPKGFEAGPNEEPEDEDVALDTDEDLPWPSPKLVMDWWTKHKKDFKPGKRYLRGQEITKKSLINTLIQGNQRQRSTAAMELALREPSQPLFEVCAQGKRQLEKMGSWTS